MSAKLEGGRAFCPSSSLPFLNVRTDGVRKKRHNDEVRFVIGTLIKNGIKDYNCDHISDGNLVKWLPLQKNGKFYDISYINSKGDIILIEVMRLNQEVEK